MVDDNVRPGVMLFFSDLRPILSRLSNAELGELFHIIVDFSEFGAEPSDPSGMVGFAFDVLRPGLERDEVRYQNAIAQRRYAVYCRERKKLGEEPPTFEEWRESIDEQRPITTDNGRYPTPSPSPSPSPAPAPTPSPSTSPTPSPSPAPKTNSVSTAASAATGGVGGPHEMPELPTTNEADFERLRRERMAALNSYGM